MGRPGPGSWKTRMVRRRAHVLGVEHGRYDEILDMLARDEHSHVDAVPAHQAGQPVDEPGILDARALAQRENAGQRGAHRGLAAVGRGLRADRSSGEDGCKKE